MQPSRHGSRENHLEEMEKEFAIFPILVLFKPIETLLPKQLLYCAS